MFNTEKKEYFVLGKKLTLFLEKERRDTRFMMVNSNFVQKHASG